MIQITDLKLVTALTKGDALITKILMSDVAIADSFCVNHQQLIINNLNEEIKKIE